jgi:hypothetical protein
MLNYSINRTNCRLSIVDNHKNKQDYPISSLERYEIITTAHRLGFKHINCRGYYIADNGKWLPDPMRGTPAPLSKPQLDILYALFLKDAYSEDGTVDIAFICNLFDGLYTHQDVRDALHWMCINGALSIDKDGWYDLSEVTKQSELFLDRIEGGNPQ